MKLMNESNFPIIHYFEQDFITMYGQTWAHIEANQTSTSPQEMDIYADTDDVEDDLTHIIDATFSSFALSYANAAHHAMEAIDFFYQRQEENGAIRCVYSKSTHKPVAQRGNPKGLMPPIIIWAEYNHFNKTDNKKRLKEIVPKLDKYLQWIESIALEKNGLFHVPLPATYMHNAPRKHAHYFIDFNAQMAMAYLYMSKIASFTNHRNLVIKYTKAYYTLKKNINSNFWDSHDGFYYDLDKEFNPVKEKTIASFWTMLAQLPNNDQIESLINYLKSPQHFYTENLFPTLSCDSVHFSQQGLSFRGSVYPIFTYMVIKGLEIYNKHEFARECAIKHLYGILSVYQSDNEEISHRFWEAYQPNHPLPAKPGNKNSIIHSNNVMQIAVSTITLMIENIIGFEINLPKKMVRWVITNLEEMGIEHINLKKNHISTVMYKTSRGWEIRHISEKLYYFSVEILELGKHKTLPIPSGKCSLLVEKI